MTSKRLLTIAAVAVVIAASLAGCSSSPTAPAASNAGDTSAATKPAAPKADWYATTYGTFTPVSKAGTGDSVIVLPAGAKAGIVTATFSGANNFSIQALDKSNKPTVDLLANTIGAYKGTSAFGLQGLGNKDATLKVTASGKWTIRIAPMDSTALLPAAGAGDGVFKYSGKATTWKLTHTGEGNFALVQYSADPMPNLAANTIGKYSGTVPSMAGPSIVAITADGTWTVK